MTGDEARALGKALRDRDEAARNLAHISFVIPGPDQRKEVAALKAAAETYVEAESALRRLVAVHLPGGNFRDIVQDLFGKPSGG